MKRFILGPVAVVIAALGVALLPAPSAGAVARTPQAGGTNARCAVAEQRLGDILSQLQSSSDSRSAIYQDAHKTFTARLGGLKKAGYDTAKLAAHLRTAKQQLVDYRAKAEVLSASLQSAQASACSESDAGFKQALVQSRGELKSVREAAQKTHETYRTLILPEVRAAAASLRSNPNAQGN